MMFVFKISVIIVFALPNALHANEDLQVAEDQRICGQPHAEGEQVTALMGSLKDNGRVVRDPTGGAAGDLSLFRLSPPPRAF